MNIVGISFVDSAIRPPVEIKDNMHFILGSLGEDGGIFATDVAEDDDDDIDEDVKNAVDSLGMSDRTKDALKKSQRRRRKKDSDEDDAKGSTIFFYRFKTFGPLKDKDWQMALPAGERALGCACGSGWVGVVTSFLIDILLCCVSCGIAVDFSGLFRVAGTKSVSCGLRATQSQL
eukprot:10034788-Ditylum_brightwellii.AAC.1